jgi:prophage antirepressor-like protein
MQTSSCPSAPLHPTTFHRHSRPLNVVLLEAQVWFSAQDLSRFIGWPLNERTTRKLDEDQRRVITLDHHYGQEQALMLSESGVYALLIRHHHAENRCLRQWISNDVVPALRDAQRPPDDSHPSLSLLQWPELSVTLLHWQSEPWIRLRDLPRMVPHNDEAGRKQSRPWWRAAWEVLRFT